MPAFSIVIVSKNAEQILGRLLDSIRGLSDEIIVCDTGSTDATPRVAAEKGATVHHIPWEGYGKSKNRALAFAKNDWILSLDSDEEIDPVLYDALRKWEPEMTQSVYQLRWKNFLGKQWIRYGGFQNDWKPRLFNRTLARWDDAIIHEDICSHQVLSYHKMPGYINHYTYADFRELSAKYQGGAMITAEKYHRLGKKTGFLAMVFKPTYSFFQSYILQLGFLNGQLGWLIATSRYCYTFMKYARLYELSRTQTAAIEKETV